MKKILVFALTLLMVLSLAACGGGSSGNNSTSTPASQGNTETSTTPSSVPDNDDTTSDTPAQDSGASHEVFPADVEIDGVPDEAKMGIGAMLYAMELSSADPFAAGWLAAFGEVTQDDFSNYSAYFDALPGADKSGESGDATYNFEWGAVQIAYNPDDQQLNVTWLVH